MIPTVDDGYTDILRVRASRYICFNLSTNMLQPISKGPRHIPDQQRLVARFKLSKQSILS